MKIAVGLIILCFATAAGAECIKTSQQTQITSATAAQGFTLARGSSIATLVELTQPQIYELKHTDSTARWQIINGQQSQEIPNRVGPTGSSFARLLPGENLICIWSDDQHDNQGTVTLEQRHPTPALEMRAALDSTVQTLDEIVARAMYLQVATTLLAEEQTSAAIDAYIAHARLQMVNTQMHQAQTTLKEAVKYARRYNQDSKLPWIYYWLGNALAATGHPKASLDTFQLALAASTSANLNARLQNYIGLNYLTLGGLDDALIWLERAAQNSEVSANPLLKAMVVNNLGGLYLRQGDGQKAGKFFDRAASTYQKLDDHHLAVTTLSTAATAYRSIGDYTTALNRLHQALALEPTSGHGRGGLLQSLGKLHADFENWARAHDYYASATEDVELTQDRLAMAISNWLLGAVEIRLGEFTSGARKLAQAVGTFQTSGDINGALNAGCTLAQAYLEQDDRAATHELLDSLADSIRQARQQQLSNTLACLDQTQGKLDFLNQDFTAGEIKLVRAAKTYGANAAVAAQIGVLNDLAQLQLAAGQLSEAVLTTDRTASLLTQMTVQNSIGLERRAIANSRRGWVDLKVRLAFELATDPLASEAFAASMENRGAISGAVSRDSSNPENDLARLLMRKSVLINSDQQGAALKKVMLAIAARETQQPARSADLPRPRLTLSLKQVAASLARDTTLLHFHLTQEKGYVWRITHNDTSVHELPSSQAIHASAARLHAALSQAGGHTRWQQAAADLSALIIDPVVPVITTRNLVISADASLVQVPFAVLPVTDAQGSATRIGQQASLSYLPWSGMPASSIVTLPVSATMMTVSTTDFAHATLPGIDQEESALRQLVGTQLSIERLTLTDKDTVRTTLEGSGEILHLSAHAFAHLHEPGVSAITAYADPYQSLADEQALTALEIASMNLKSRIVVLNACETGVVIDHIGNESNSLAGAFISAGAEHVVSSLWRIPGIAAATFSREFYQALGAGNISIAAAINTAQARMRTMRQWRHPHFWSGFVLISKPTK